MDLRLPPAELHDWRTNRFTTHARCMRRCKPLVDLYLEILSREPRNLSAYIRSQSWDKSARRDSGDDADGTDIEEDEYDPPRIEHNLNGPAPTLDVKTADHNDWAVTVDIDDVR
ncbi:uncharacterized protein LOC120634476 isoform X2 [Pararge aegeria]|uniref:uncharacterized protein LOC120634476 isoform X2 n=1 Tax=Pararge aegeria TaxID=116150 RepID=UPI0019CFD77F|nr:uncharacterized protein LOC120634476 isoform X2 [Pararge aegeria]